MMIIPLFLKKKLDEILKHDLWWDADTCLDIHLLMKLCKN